VKLFKHKFNLEVLYLHFKRVRFYHFCFIKDKLIVFMMLCRFKETFYKRFCNKIKTR
jgi:hypothetical protein